MMYSVVGLWSPVTVAAAASIRFAVVMSLLLVTILFQGGMYICDAASVETFPDRVLLG